MNEQLYKEKRLEFSFSFSIYFTLKLENKNHYYWIMNTKKRKKYKAGGEAVHKNEEIAAAPWMVMFWNDFFNFHIKRGSPQPKLRNHSKTW